MYPESNGFRPAPMDLGNDSTPVAPDFPVTHTGPAIPTSPTGLKGKLVQPGTKDLVPPERVCPNCGRFIAPDATSCVHCGWREKKHVNPPVSLCVKCGRPLAPGATFCNHCGTNQRNGHTPPPAKYCRSCGAQITSGDYCSRCAPGRSTFDHVNPPVGQLKTNKGLLKTILLSMITFGIYPLVVMSAVSNDINIVASRYDGKKTMHYCLLFFIFNPLTFGICGIVWAHRIANRIGNELRRRGIPYSFSAADFWLWNILGSMIVVGPFIYLHKLFKSVNMMNSHYNQYG